MFYSSPRGNALFLILMAVALFAALSYALTQAGRGGGGVTREKTKLQEARLTQYASEISQAVMRLKVTGGCADTEISFDGHKDTSANTNGTSYNYSNPFSPVDGSCNVFSKAGGGVEPRKIPSELVIPVAACASCLAPDSWFVSASRVKGVGSDTGGAASTDLLLWMGRVTRETCLSINNTLGIPNPGGNPPQETFDCQDSQFQGVYDNCSDPIGDLSELEGKTDFCFDWDGAATDNGYLYIHVILAR